MSTSGPIFLGHELFQIRNIWEPNIFSFTFYSIFGTTWLCTEAALIIFSFLTTRIIKRDELNASNIWWQVHAWKIVANICFFLKYQFSQWTAVGIKFSFSRFFFNNTWFLFVESLKIIRPALPVFWPKSPKKSHFSLEKIFVAKFWYFSIYTKKITCFRWKWSKK